jgi:hypothetical protein
MPRLPAVTAKATAIVARSPTRIQARRSRPCAQSRSVSAQKERVPHELDRLKVVDLRSQHFLRESYGVILRHLRHPKLDIAGASLEGMLSPRKTSTPLARSK